MSSKNKYMRLFAPLVFSALLHAEDALIWYPGASAANSATAIQSALTANSKTSVKTTSLSGYTLSNYRILFICLGVYPNNYVLSQTNNSSDINAVISYLQNGGSLYMEGGDTWAWDFPTDLHGWFNLYGEADGEADLGTLLGASCFIDLRFSYSGSQQHIDRLAPLEGATVIFTNTSPAYACGITYEDGYRTIGLSFEFGGLADGDDTKATLMNHILDYFDNGCSGSKPAPLNVQAFSNYNNAVPLVWDAPPGQTAMAQSQPLLPSLTASLGAMPVRKPFIKAGRTRANAEHFTKMAKIASAGYQADAYNVYRSTSENGSYTRIAANVNRSYYRDETVLNGFTYYYFIKAVYNGQEGEASIKTSAQPSAQNSSTAPWKFVAPSINGCIEMDEWSNAASFSITAPGAPNAATLYAFNDDDYLFLALDDPGNLALTTDDQLGLNFDKNLDFDWPSTSLNDEGTLWLSWNGGSLDILFRGLSGHWPNNMRWVEPVNVAGITAAAATTAGHVQYEMRIDLTHSIINLSPGETIGIYAYSLDMPDSTFTAAWPGEISTCLWYDAWMVPALYGVLELSEKESCPFIVDDENITVPSAYTFNEFGDGRKLLMTIATLTGSGDVTVRQTNGCLTNPINNNYINCVWNISGETGITDIITDISFFYNDNDVSSLDETKLQVHWWNGSIWQYEGGMVDAASNKVTIRTNHFGDFALFAREHVLLNANVFLQGAYEGSGLMRTSLSDGDMLPLKSTYADGRILYSMPTDICDWMMIELRTTPDGAPVTRRSFLVRKNGAIVDWDGTATTLSLPDALDGDYYVVISHRNHLSVMSAVPLLLKMSTPATINFTTALSTYYGRDAKLLESGIYGMYAGDANGNGQVQNDDKNDYWKNVVGSSGYVSADFNLNGQVQNDDKNDFWKPNVGRGTQVP